MLLESQHNLQVVGEANNGKEVVDFLESDMRVDLVLTDIDMEVMGGMELADYLQHNHPHIKVILLSMLDDVKYVREAFKRGVLGYLVKNVDYDELLFAIQHVAKGGTYVCGELTSGLLQTMADLMDKAGALSHDGTHFELSDRETEILQLISEGFTNAEIADKLFLSKRTVEGHRQNLINRLEVKNSAELIKLAVRHGLVD